MTKLTVITLPFQTEAESMRNTAPSLIEPSMLIHLKGYHFTDTQFYEELLCENLRKEYEKRFEDAYYSGFMVNDYGP